MQVEDLYLEMKVIWKEMIVAKRKKEEGRIKIWFESLRLFKNRRVQVEDSIWELQMLQKVYKSKIHCQ